ncbi:MAG: helix-turn-helix transcriptional regulator [Caldilineaceae bacterium]|nr:helix-turn-helix transcriptional regulator [Caldilineaceae bacterium]
MSNYSVFANLLDEYLTRRERSGAWLAQRLHINPATVSRWRNGDSRPGSPEVVVQMADLLQISAHDCAQMLAAIGYAAAPMPTPNRSGEYPVGLTPVARGQSSPTAIWQHYPPDYCYREMRTIAHWIDIGASGIVLGLPGSGVSTLLRYLSHRSEVLSDYLVGHKLVVPIWLELQPMAEPVPTTIYRLFLRGLLTQSAQLPTVITADLRHSCQSALRDTDLFVLQTWLFTLIEHFQRAQITLLFAFDRTDALPPETQMAVGTNLRLIRDQFRETVLYLMGMRRRATYFEDSNQLGELGSLLSLNLCVVRGLTEKDSLFTIGRRTALAGKTPSTQDVEHFLALTGGYPSLLKGVIQWWLTTAPPSPHQQWQPRLLREPGIQYHLREIWRALAPAERMALQTLQHHRNGQALSPEASEELARLGLLCRADDDWQFAGSLFTGLTDHG